MTVNPDDEASSADTFRILVATDTHLGYVENDRERGNDSFNSFEEMLQIAKSQQVDFILLGGDLFHENKPSTSCLHKCMALLREYCMGDKPISVEFRSDQNVNFQHCSQPIVNYEDPNLNISIPVFSIHGNHDDPSGQSQLCSLDLLSTSGLVNYFGKWTDLYEVKICPLLLRKGKSLLALYGLSHIKDERLSRLFRDNQVHMYRPTENTEDWFNIFVCHQNRAERGFAKYIPEEALPDFFDLVVWGHEHECRIKEEWNEKQRFFVTQPGSSVATSLCEGEAKEKFVALLEICGKKFKIQPIKLQTVRPFIYETLTLSNCTLPLCDSTSNSVVIYVEDRLKSWLRDACDQYTGHQLQPRLPLVRIRIEYCDESQCFNAIRFGQKYLSEVANPNDMIMLKPEKKAERKVRENDDDEKDNMDQFLQNEDISDIWEVKMNQLTQKYFDEISDRNLRIFSVKGISEAVARFIDKCDKECIKLIVEHQMNKIRNHFLTTKVDINNIDDELYKFMEVRQKNISRENVEVKDLLETVRYDPARENGELSRIGDCDGVVNSEQETDGEDEPTAPLATSSRGSRNRNGSRNSRGATAARSALKTSTATSSKPRRRARGNKNTSTSRASLSVVEQLRASSCARATRSSYSKPAMIYDDSDDED